MSENHIVANPIRIFISSGCGDGKERYNKIRKDLKERIEKTGMASVFLFENSKYASSLTASKFYLRELDDSDLCIFLIDNEDGIFDGVAPEIHRARANNKKSIYIFCTEKSREHTWVQKQLQGPKGEKYYEVSSFELFPDKVYESLLNDISIVYRYYCRDWLIDNEQNVLENKIEEIDNISHDSLKKTVVINIDRTKIHLSKMIFDNHRKVEKTSALDEYCEQLLEVVLGERRIDQFNTSLLLMELERQQSKDYFAVVQLRWKAINAYFMDKLDECELFLNEAKSMAENSNAPNWILSDILVDLQNVTKLFSYSSNSILIESEYQNILNESSEILFYPALDRLVSNFYEAIDTSRIKEALKSPYTHRFGNDIDILTDYVASAFVVAAFNASLTHLIMIHDRLHSLALFLCQEYDDWYFRVLALKFTTLTFKNNELTDTIQTFNEILGKMNANDAKQIYDFTNCVPVKIQQIIAKLSTFENFGYYFSDEDYQNIFNEILGLIKHWINSENPNIFIGRNIFMALQTNVSRGDKNEILDICLATLTPKTRRFWDDALKVISYLGAQDIECDRVEKTVNRLIELVKFKDDRDNIHSLDYAVINLRKTATGYGKMIDDCVKEFWPEFYFGIYSLEIESIQESIALQQIEKYLALIKRQNEEQGVDGKYSSYVYNPYEVIENIIKDNPSILSVELVNRVVLELNNTVVSKRQTSRAKMNAYYLTAVLCNIYPKAATVYLKIENSAKQLETKEFEGKNISLDSISGFNVKWTYSLLQLANKTADLGNVLNVCSLISDVGDAEKIEAIRLLSRYLSYINAPDNDIKMILAYLSVCLQSLSSKNHSIRYYAISSLLNLITSETYDTISRQLLMAMDFDSIQIKLNILRNIEKLKLFDKEATIGIKQKAKSDTNFIIRQYCKTYLI